MRRVVSELEHRFHITYTMVQVEVEGGEPSHLHGVGRSRRGSRLTPRREDGFPFLRGLVISGDAECPVMIAMTVVLMVKVTVDEIVDVTAMRNGGMTAAGTMAMSGVMGAADVPIRARAGVRSTHRDGVFVDVAVMVVMQMPVVEIVDVIVVADREVSTVVSVNVTVILVRTMRGSHGGSFLVRVLAAVVVGAATTQSSSFHQFISRSNEEVTGCAAHFRR
jgi:hypothetical protein